MNNIKGSVIVEVRDATTMQLKNTIKSDNVITHAMFLNDMFTIGTDNKWIDVGQHKFPVPRQLAVSSRIIAPNNKTLSYRAIGVTWPTGGSYPPATDYVDQSSLEQEWEFTNGAPPYVEMKSRFDSPTSVRTINSIFLVAINNPEFVATAIGLNTPCIQNPGEVLDITYRIQVFDAANASTTESFVSSDYHLTGYLASRLSGSTVSGTPTFMHGSPFALPDVTVENEIIRSDVTSVSTGTGERFESIDNYVDRLQTYENDHFKVKYTAVVDKTQMVGRVLRTAQFCGTNTQSFDTSAVVFSANELESFTSAEVMSKLLPVNFQHKPIQPIHNHSANAVEWGLDVDYLASSQGSITVNGDNWEELDWPEMWRVEFTSTGAIGTSNYCFRNRRHIGFYDGSYRPTYVNRLNDLMDIDHPIRTTVNSSRSHGVHDIMRNVEYGADSYVSWDSDGINLHFINKSKVLAFDATTVPALNATGIVNVAVTDNGDIWIACRNTGLYKITDPTDKNIASISKMTEAGNGIVTGGGNNCYAVAVGYNNSIWAVFNGAISHTTIPTVATPSFDNYNELSSTPLVYLGLTDNNWDLVKYIKVDRSSADNQLAIMFAETSSSQRIVWWSLAGTATQGPLSGNYVSATYDGWDNNQITNVNVSRYGGMWTRIGPNATHPVQLLEWGTNNNTNITRLFSTAMARTMYFYDYYNTPYIGNNTSSYAHNSTSTSTSYGQGLVTPDGVIFATSSEFTSQYSFPVNGLAWENKRASGMFVNAGNNGSTSEYRRSGERSYVYQMAPSHNNSILDALNGQYSPYEELCWDRYHWNGTDWELNYFVDATDTSGGTTYPAQRHNFDTESHRFTGRSMIDLSSAINSTDFSSDITLVASIQPHQKQDSSEAGSYHDYRSKRQEFPITLFDFSTATRQCKLMWKTDNNSSPVIAFYNDGVEESLGTATPVNISSGFYRVVLSISGTSVNVYLDGTQIGSTITIPSVYDFSNTSNELYAFLGCRVFQWDYSQRNSPWQSEFFKGYMENVQIWNAAWNSTDVTNDYANINGVISSKPVSNLIARYELTEDLSGTETKPTHAASEVLAQGIEVAFQDGTSGNSFVATDYYTFNVVDGIVKDNATSFTREMSIYHKPVDDTFAEFTNTSDLDTIEGVNAVQVTEPAYFKSTYPPITSTSTNESDAMNISDAYPGALWYGRESTFVTDAYQNTFMEGAYTHQPLLADGYFEVKAATADTSAIMGFVESTNITEFNTSSSYTGAPFVLHGFMLKPNGSFDIREAGSNVVVDAGAYTLDTTLRVKRTGTVVTYHTVDNGVESLVYTSTVASSNTLYGCVIFPHAAVGIVDASINFSRLSNTMSIGSEVSGTGKFDPRFLRVDAIDQLSYYIELDAVPATIIMLDSVTHENYPAPAPLEVVIDSRSGLMIFNDADISKTVTGRVTVIYDEL